VVAAAEFHVQPATIRSWRRRVKAEGDAPAEAVNGSAPTPSAMRQKADEARAMSLRALEQADRMISRSQGSEARNAATTSAILAERATELEQAAREEESHQARIAQADGEAIAKLMRTFHHLVGLPDAWGGDAWRGGSRAKAAEKLFGQMLREMGTRGEPRFELKPPRELVADARREIIERFRDELRDAVLERLMAQGAHPALPPPGSVVDRAIEGMTAPVTKVIIVPPEELRAEAKARQEAMR
jgi:hypothetical protein